MADTKYRLGVLIALGAAACFGIANTVIGLAFEAGANPLSMAATRFVLPAVLLLAILAFAGKPVILPWRQGLISILLGMLTGVYTIGLLTALKVLPAGIAILVFYLFPIITAIIVSVMGWAKINRPFVIAALVAFAGLALALGVKIAEYDPFGILYAFIAAVGLAVVSSVSARVIAVSDPRQATLYMSTGSFVALMVVLLIFGGFAAPQTTLGWVGFFATHVFYAAAIIGFFYAVALIGAAGATMFSNIEPLVVITGAFLVLGQTLAPLQLVGAVVVVVALSFAARSKAH